VYAALLYVCIADVRVRYQFIIMRDTRHPNWFEFEHDKIDIDSLIMCQTYARTRVIKMSYITIIQFFAI